MNLHIAISILLLGYLPQISAQVTMVQSSEAEAAFRKGVFLYTSGEKAKALEEFDRILRNVPLNQRTTAAWIMKGKVLLAMDEPAEAGRVLRDFLATFPASSFVADAEYTLGLAYLTLGRTDDAVAQLRASLQQSMAGPPRLRDHSERALELTLYYYFAVPAIRPLLENCTDQERLVFLFVLAKKYAESGSNTDALQLIDTINVRYPASRFEEELAVLRKKASELNRVKIGALMPLMINAPPSAIKDIGTEVYEGVQFAVEELQRRDSSFVRVSAEVRNTDRDPQIAATVTEELLSDRDVIGIIGPVFSNVATSVAPQANSRGVPMLTPTANTNGIAATGPYIFQANPDYETRGRAIAQYAVRVRGMKRFAVLAPSDTYGRFMADAFQNEVEHLGGTIIAAEWYVRGSSDLKTQLYNIRKAGMLVDAEPMLTFSGKINQGVIANLIQSGASPKKIDSLIEVGGTASGVDLLGPYARTIIDSLGIPATYENPQIDSLEYPVTTIEGIYFPISSPGEIGVLSSQLVYFNFNAQMFGSGEWNNLPELDANHRYAEGVIFEATDFVDETDSVEASFMARFQNRFRKKPSRNSYYGYDSAELMVQLIHGGALTREALREALSRTAVFQGLHSKIGFAGGRVNPWLHILQYSRNTVVRLMDLEVGTEQGAEEIHEEGAR